MNTDKLAVALGFKDKHIMKRFFELYPDQHNQIKALRLRTYDQWFRQFSSEAAIIVNLALNNIDSFNEATINLHHTIDTHVKLYVNTLPDYNKVDYLEPLTDLDDVMQIEHMKIDPNF